MRQEPVEQRIIIKGPARTEPVEHHAIIKGPAQMEPVEHHAIIKGPAQMEPLFPGIIGKKTWNAYTYSHTQGKERMMNNDEAGNQKRD